MTEKKSPLDIGSWPRWKQIVFFVVAVVLGMAALEYAKVALRGEPPQTADEIVQKLQEVPDTPPVQFMDVIDQAKAGDYQAQRNLAYGFAASPYPGQQKNRVLGCAWYLVVLNSGHPQADESDTSNAQTYCGPLDADLLDTAKYYATKFLAEITAAQKLTKLP